jgi:predicted glycoside hydrolase/deacetylase ChbG (UPF0249 family)
MTSPPALLIVNADDYGYFPCVNQGIRRAARDGILTATGIFANGRLDDADMRALLEETDLDLGVHLNLTHGEPLHEPLRRRLGRAAGRFPGKFRAAAMVVSGLLGRELVRGEWRAQIERCLALGARPRFLNSHEHIHMLPALFRLTQELATEYGIDHVRFTTPDPEPAPASGALLRDSALALAARLSRGGLERTPARMLGLGVSGRLDRAYLEHVLPKLNGGEVYELMCHPGHCQGGAETSPELARYHAWELELGTLTDPAARELLDRHNVRAIGYRELDDARLSTTRGAGRAGAEAADRTAEDPGRGA